MTQSGSSDHENLTSNDDSQADSSRGRSNIMGETDSIRSTNSKYAPSLVSVAESVMISAAMPPSKIISQLSRHGCNNITNQLNLETVTESWASNGGCGDVYRGKLYDGRRVGVKCLRMLIGMDEEGEKQVKRASQELYIWSKCKHPNIQELIGVAIYKNQLAMVSPWMTNGNLSWYISKNPGVDRYNLCVQAAAAVAYLRECNVVHGDIKGENYLVSDDGVVKLADFGSSMINQCSLRFSSNLSSPQMTLRWTAPEIFLDETQQTYEGDVYALGMTILEIITGAVPWGGMLTHAVINKLIQRLHPPRPEAHMPSDDQLSNTLWDLMVRCWASEPKQRPLSAKVLDELSVINEQHRLALYGTDSMDTHEAPADTQNIIETPSNEEQSLEKRASPVLSSRRSLLERVLRRPSNKSLRSLNSSSRRPESVASSFYETEDTPTDEISANTPVTSEAPSNEIHLSEKCETPVPSSKRVAGDLKADAHDLADYNHYSILTSLNPKVLQHLVYHVFLPPQLPQEGQNEAFQRSVDLAIVRWVIQAGQEYRVHMEASSQWPPIDIMLRRLCNYIEAPPRRNSLSMDIWSMKQGDLISLYVKAQNAGVIIRKQLDHTTFEAFEVQARTQDVMSTPGKIVRHFPGPAVQVPNSVASDRDFVNEVANILEQMNTEILNEARPKSRRAGIEVLETENSINPNYFIQFFFGYLRGMGTAFDPTRVVKRLGDEVLWVDAMSHWRRSPIWLIVRVALQTSLDPATYKQFMVYLHATILSECCKHESFSSDLLYTMRVKMARRLYKLRDTAPQFLISAAKAITNQTQEVLQGRWNLAQSTQAQSTNQDFSRIDFNSATHQTLPNSRGYLERVFLNHSGHIYPTPFTPRHSPRLENVADFSRYANGGLSQAFKKCSHLALFDFEASVFDNLGSWTSKQFDHAGACDIMQSCFQQYLTTAKSYYTADIADQSVMVLTLVRIWMAIDQLATADCPLLHKFSPEFPNDILDPLLLRTTQHIAQARLIQEYIRGRHSNVSTVNPSVFSNRVTSTSFAVQYFRSSLEQQRIKSAIEKDAQELKDRKLEEMEALNSKYSQLSNKLKGMDCDYRPVWGGKRMHSTECKRCQTENERKTLEIHPHEWPLPRQQLNAEVVVFELQCPRTFVIWRNATYTLLVDLGTPSGRAEGKSYRTLEEHNPLSNWYLPLDSMLPRLSFAYKESLDTIHLDLAVRPPVQERQVCLDQTVNFGLYDKNGGTWVSGLFHGATFAPYGTFKLQKTSQYRHLEYAIEGTTHSSNRVLADQYDCPKELSLHEHTAFGTLRSGARLQWMNIVRGLEEDLLTFSSDEVQLLHTQAAWQIGPLMDDGSREWHEELRSVAFGRLLVSECRRMLDRVRANWLQTTSVSTIVMLVTRLLASVPSEDIVKLACSFLREARDVAYNWLQQLKLKLQHVSDEKDVVGYQQRVCEMAIMCQATYDVGPQHMGNLLSNSDDFIPLVYSSIALYYNMPSNIKRTRKSLQIHLCRSRRFAHKVTPFMLASIRAQDILSKPLFEIWPDYRPGPSGWQVYGAPNHRWVTSTTARVDGDRTQEVHLNLLTGELLIDGKPLGCLPGQYVKHATYLRPFGQKNLDIVPAKAPGMEFATRDRIHGYQVLFGLEKGTNRLIIQARIGSRLYELIPHEKLSNDFPLFFSQDYHHWADIKNQVVEFRPVSSPWSSDECQWFLRFNRSGEATLGDTTGNTSLIDIHSSAFKSLSRSIHPLESDRYLHVTRSIDDHVNIELPRMKLSFFINADGQLESRNFREQVLDENQSSGTLFGLKNQLILRAKGSIAQSLPRSRSVLIPDGEIEFTTCGYQVSVSVQFDSRRNVDVYRYRIDKDLRQLSTDAGLTSRLFKIYLHALTSHCLPDPLTGRTGTEEALDELSQASTSSFEQINLKQAGLLKAIGLLSPEREYYPTHHTNMQRTSWTSLPFLSQHFAFSFGAVAVLRRADTLQLFYPLDFKIHEYISALETSAMLLKRTVRQTALYYPPDTTGYITQIMGSTTIMDNVCPGRDTLIGEWEAAGQAARWASSLAHQNWGRPIYKSCDLVSLAESWRALNDSKKYDSLNYRSAWFNLDLNCPLLTFFNLLRCARASSNRYILSACLASVAFGQAVPTDLIPVFLAFATVPKFASLAPPALKLSNFRDGYEPVRRKVEGFVSSAAYSVSLSPASGVAQKQGESRLEFCSRQEAYHNRLSQEFQSHLVDSLIQQWPSLQLKSTNPEFYNWVEIESVLKATRLYYSSCIMNAQMKDYLQKLKDVLVSHPSSVGIDFRRVDVIPLQSAFNSLVLAHPWNNLSISNLMNTRLAPPTHNIPLPSKFSGSHIAGPATDTTRIGDLFAELQKSLCPLNRRYGIDLDESRIELDTKPSEPLPRQLPPLTILNQTRERWLSHLAGSFKLLSSSISPQTEVEDLVAASGVWPRITPRSLLQQLSLRNRNHLVSLLEWRQGLIAYAQAFSNYQQSQRLIVMAESGNLEEFHNELDLTSAGSPDVDDPDWLLVQIDGDFGTRAVQCQVAREMISPSSGSNSVLQLNMGEGKSSVIVPIIASSLADSSRLVRVVVLKPLWRQMFDLLVSRLSGLSNRRIYYLPFVRHLYLNSSRVQNLRSLYEECMREGGILLAQPEHILSFKLMGIDRLITSSGDGDGDINGDTEVANSLRGMQNWLETYSRDILDESDEILNVRYQLVYAAGAQQPLDDHPNRWTTTQQLLRLAATHIKRLHQEHPDNVLYKHFDCGQFPVLRIMPDCPPGVEKELITTIAADVRDGRLLNLNCDCLRPSVREHLLEFFTNSDIPYSLYKSLRKNCDPTIWKGLLLVRGLLASGILVFALKHKHYRVDYGLDLGRSLLAVPYRAKDLPSLKAEFGHPDVAVVLTCFSYYYQGLTSEQLDLCFELLFKLDNPSLEYEQWAQRNEATPEDLRQLSGANIKDRQQFTERLFPTFSHNSATIEFFLSSVVFPKEAKEFPEKLATSGWDLAKRKANVTTGFSGTNDNRYLLPTSIKQDDPIGQLSTSALVLTYLLQPENNHYLCMRDGKGQSLATEEFLKLLVAQTPEVRVLLDVGARMLELHNEQLVRCWLGLRSDIEGAVYFNDRDELVVLPQNGTPVLLNTSPFAQRLDKCIVYLDDGHTRGTDLKLPSYTRALVTLGPKVTKDRLLQGCMRMRKLGHGQSVMFAAPPEIDTQIRNAAPNPIGPNARIDTLDILRWAMLETCKDLQHHVSHWAQQGIEYYRRYEAEARYEKCGKVSILAKDWAKSESRPLEDMYGVLSPEQKRDRGSFTQRVFGVSDLRRGLEHLGIMQLEDPSMDEEQEREVSHVIERPPQTQRPPKRQPLPHSIHPDVKHFVSTGTLPSDRDRSGILSLFLSFRSYNSQMSNSWSDLLYASIDFLQTVAESPIDRFSEYMRPVNWIVSGTGDVRVVLSPHEVNELLPIIRRSSEVHLHVYAPRVSLAMLSFSDLRFYSIPSPSNPPQMGDLLAPQLQLDLFAGQLYFSSYQDYTTICTTLGLHIPSTNEDSGIQIESDGFVKPEHRHYLIGLHPKYSNCQFKSTPIPALKDLIGRRRKGMKYLLTHVGKVLHARSMTPADF